ncbi:AAA family ATPase [Aestuariibius insulae]|uniref:AAA family ATPase n=1 Tax=Aestuariibius insulae TaxID=2058287 RepID=UPI00345EA79C
MYVKNTLIINSGPLADLNLAFEFNNTGAPKPMVIVGVNGSGKSNFLAFMTDALIEIAVKKFIDVAPRNDRGGHVWYRVIGSATVRTGSQYELALIRFEEGTHHLTYLSKCGQLEKDDIQEKLIDFPQAPNWTKEGSHKIVNGAEDEIERIFWDGCYVSFPTNRAESPYWSINNEKIDDSLFVDRYENLLRQPILVQSSLNEIRPWLVDVLFDQMIDSAAMFMEPNEQAIAIRRATRNYVALSNINSLLGKILGRPNARLVRTGRYAGTRKLMVVDRDEVLLPSLDAFSSGQSMLFGIFATILRYADGSGIPKSMHDMQGIVVIDEVDAHLHADLQHDILPNLISLFPKIQFIVSAHSPLFPLGMDKLFGEDNFTLVDFPSGRKIGVERFSQFDKAFQYLSRTKRFEVDFNRRISEATQPLLIVEGAIDIDYIKKAAERLNKTEVLEKFEILDGNGFKGLDKIWKNMQHERWTNIAQTVLLLYDCDVNYKNNRSGRALQKTIPKQESIIDKGIENLFTTETIRKARQHRVEFIDHAAASSTTIRGVESRTLEEWSVNKDEKRNLCNWLCENGTAADFDRFSIVFDILEKHV